MRRAVRITRGVAWGMLLTLVVGLVGVLVVVPRATGSVALNVLSGSMSPTIPVGAVVLVKPVDAASIQPGDVITFQVAPGVDQYVTHRVVRTQLDTTPPSFITKGDANRGEDVDPVPAGAVRGEVWIHVPYIGQVSEYVQGPRGWGLLASVGGLMLLVHLIGKVVSGHRAPASRTESA